MNRQAREVKDSPRRGEVRAFAFELKAADEAGQIEGYGSVFGVRDDYGDVVAPGAFAATLADHKAAGTMPAMLWQHDPTEPIGVWTDMVEDARGLRVRGQIVMETERGRAAHALLLKGALRGLSIGFRSQEWTYDRNLDVRTLTKVQLGEVSLVTFPANGKAMVETVKSAADEWRTPKDAEQALREAGFSRKEATAFVSRLMRMGEERRDAVQSAVAAQNAADRLLRIMTNKDA